LPDSYSEPLTAVSAIFDGLLTKVGVYALIRTFTLLFVQDIAFTHSFILGLAALTMIIGVLGAIVQNHFKRILSYHQSDRLHDSGSWPVHPSGVGGVDFLYHPSHHRQNGSFPGQWHHRARHWHSTIARDGGLLNTYPTVATLFMLAALSLAGMPPLSGFFAKLVLLTAGVQEAQYFYVGVALLGSLLTLVSMSKIYLYVFWGEEKSKRARAVRHADLLLPTAFLVLIIMALGLIGEPVFQLTQQAATQLFARETFIEAVFAAAQGAK
jgi:multicomponent Na+:H+ antiporter subunit D